MLPLAISAGYTHPFAPDSITHDGVAASAEIRPQPVVSFGVSGTLYAPFEQSYTPSRAVFPLTTTYGTVSGFVKVFVLRGHEGAEDQQQRDTYDVYLLGGAGLLRHKPASVLDPEIRKFDYETSLALSFGIGLRYFVHRSLAIFADIRATSYLAQHENALVGTGNFRADRNTWLGERPMTVVVEPQIGVAFVPFAL
jgi:hypothetical protein